MSESAASPSDVPTGGRATGLATALARAVERALSALSHALKLVALVLGAVTLVGVVGLTLYQILARNLANGAAAWSEEVSTGLFVWMTFLGASYVVADGTEPKVDAVVRRLPARVRVVLAGATDGLALAVYGFLIVYGFQLAQLVAPDHMAASNLSPATTAAAIPVSAGFMAVHKLRDRGCDRSPASWLGFSVVAVLAILLFTGAITAPGASFYLLLVAGGLIFLLIGLPVAESLFLCGIVAYDVVTVAAPNVALAQYAYDGINSFSYVAVPLFLLTGGLVAATACATRLVNFARALVGWLPGGLAVSDVLSSALFADISGSVTADTAALTGVMVPQLVRDKYPVQFASGLQAAAGTLGVLFPPSLSAIIYASVANISVGYLFAALLLPAVLVVLTFSGVAIAISASRGYGMKHAASLRNVGRTMVRGAPAFGVIVLVIGGLFSGIFTATEAGAVAATYTLVLGLLGYRSKGEPFVRRAIVDTVGNVGRITFIIAGALFVSVQVVAFNGPQDLLGNIESLKLGTLLTLVVIVLVLIFLNSVLETIATILVTVPILIPVLEHMNVGLGHFGVLMQMSASVGLLVPPLGLALFLVSGVTRVPVMATAKAAAPFALGALADLLLVLVVPGVTTLIPHALGYSTV